MGEEPDRIRREIAETREQLGGRPASDRMREEFEDSRTELEGTMGALGRKADVKGRIKGSVSDAKDAVADRARSVVSKVADTAPDTDGIKHGARRVGLSASNPLGLIVGGAAVGFLTGLLVPTATVEEEKLGPVADDVTERASEAGSEMLERGKHIAEETMESARRAASEAARETSTDSASRSTAPEPSVERPTV
jgi:hypothetical protein